MNFIKYRKIKDLRKTNTGNKVKRTEKQILAATKNMILNNPMFKERNRIMQSMRMLGKPPSNPFPKGNQYWKLRKKFKHTERTKTLISMMKLGKPYGKQHSLASTKEQN
jgi:hypothetical protein